jgi:hypothetical protein
MINIFKMSHMLQRSLEDDVGELHAEPGAAGGRVTHVHQQVMEDHAGLPTVHTLYTINQILFKTVHKYK